MYLHDYMGLYELYVLHVIPSYRKLSRSWVEQKKSSVVMIIVMRNY